MLDCACGKLYNDLSLATRFKLTSSVVEWHRRRRRGRSGGGSGGFFFDIQEPTTYVKNFILEGSCFFFSFPLSLAHGILPSTAVPWYESSVSTVSFRADTASQAWKTEVEKDRDVNPALLEQLISFGYAPATAEHALKVTKSRGIADAIDFILRQAAVDSFSSRPGATGFVTSDMDDEDAVFSCVDAVSVLAFFFFLLMLFFLETDFDSDMQDIPYRNISHDSHPTSSSYSHAANSGGVHHSGFVFSDSYYCFFLFVFVSDLFWASQAAALKSCHGHRQKMTRQHGR